MSTPSDGADDLVVAGMDSPVGWLSVAVTGAGLAAVGWTTPAALAARTGRDARSAIDEATDTDPRTGPVLTQLVEYFAGARRVFELPLDWGRTEPTQRAVLQTLYDTVGYGESVTYGELATRSGTDVGARGIGAIMGSNPLPIVVPCHRVVAHDGLGGYSGGRGGHGLEVKRWLLTMEGVLPPTLDWDPAGCGVSA